MRNIGRVMIGLAMMTSASLAVAGDAKDQKPPTATKPTAGAPAAPVATRPAPPAGGGAGGAAMRPPDKQPTPPPMPMEMPKPAAELTDVFKMLKGTWNCRGSVHMPDGSSRPSVGSMKYAVDLDKFWIVTTMSEKGKNPYKFTAYMTYDAATKKWNQVSMDNMGMWASATSDGLQGNVLTWTGEGHGMGMVVKSKMTETMPSPKERQLLSQSSMDGGKTWFTDYEGVCKK